MCVVSSFTTFRPNFTSGLLQVILPRPQIGMLSLITVSPVITAFHSCCLSHRVFDQVNLWPGRIWNRYLLTMLTRNRRDSTPLSAAPRANLVFFMLTSLLSSCSNYILYKNVFFKIISKHRALWFSLSSWETIYHVFFTFPIFLDDPILFKYWYPILEIFLWHLVLSFVQLVFLDVAHKLHVDVYGLVGWVWSVTTYNEKNFI